MNDDYNSNYDKYPQTQKPRKKIPVIVWLLVFTAAINIVSALLLNVLLK
jgi:hypothetical protein